MQFALILIAIVCLGIAIFAFIQSSKKRTQEAQAPQRRDPFADATGDTAKFSPESIGPGAVLSWGNVDYVVRGTLTVQQGPYTWYEHMLDGGDGAHWLGVEVDEGQLELVMWRTQRGEKPELSDRIEYAGKVYREDERGNGHYTSEGNTGLPAQGETMYVDYSGAEGTSGDERLGLESFDGSEWELSTGHVVLPGEFTVYPAPKA